MTEISIGLGVVSVIIFVLWRWGRYNRELGKQEQRERVADARRRVQEDIFKAQDDIKDYYQKQLDAIRNPVNSLVMPEESGDGE